MDFNQMPDFWDLKLMVHKNMNNFLRFIGYKTNGSSKYEVSLGVPDFAYQGVEALKKPNRFVFDSAFISYFVILAAG